MMGPAGSAHPLECMHAGGGGCSASNFFLSGPTKICWLLMKNKINDKCIIQCIIN